MFFIQSTVTLYLQMTTEMKYIHQMCLLQLSFYYLMANKFTVDNLKMLVILILFYVSVGVMFSIRTEHTYLENTLYADLLSICV